MGEHIQALYRYLESNIERKKYPYLIWVVLKSFKKVVVIYGLFQVIIKDYFSSQQPIKFSENNIIISLTSFPGRVSTIWLVLKSIEKQTVRPSKIVLYLSEEEFPKGLISLPLRLRQYCNRGIDVVFVEDNLRSHKKYFYSLQRYNDNNIVITIDDDLYYPPDTIERLLNLSRKYPKTICGNIVRKINIKNGKFLSYKEWISALPNSYSKRYVAIGAGGILYPPKCNFSELFNINNIKTLAFHADDLWLKAVQLVNGVEVSSGEFFPHPIVIPFTQKISLKKVNSQGQVLNDKQWQALNKYFCLIDYLK